MNLLKLKLNILDKKMIKFENVTKVFFPNHRKSPIIALKNISLEIKAQEFVSIVGKSGAGKTTLLKLIYREELPTQGRVLFENKDISKFSAREVQQLRRKIGVISQFPQFLNKKTTRENVAYVMEALGFKDQEIERDVPKVLEIVGLLDKAENFPIELSAGERQRLAIARALIHRPKIILADEPTGNLDPYNAFGIAKLLLKINEMGTTVVLATHNKEIVNKIKKRVVCLENGQIIMDQSKGHFLL